MSPDWWRPRARRIPRVRATASASPCRRSQHCWNGWRREANPCAATPPVCWRCSTITAGRNSPPRWPRPSSATHSAPAPLPIFWKPAGASGDRSRPCPWRYPIGPGSGISIGRRIRWSPTMTPPDPIPTTLSDHLRQLGLLYTADELNDLVARATQKRWSPIVLLEHLVKAELDARTRQRVERRLRDARL